MDKGLDAIMSAFQRYTDQQTLNALTQLKHDWVEHALGAPTNEQVGLIHFLDQRISELRGKQQ